MPPEQAQEPLFGLGRPHRVRGRGMYVRLSLGERVRTARGYRQAVVKVTSYSHGKGQVSAHMRYITRQGKLGLETDQGVALEGKEEQKEFLDRWAADFEPRRNGRDTANIVFSAPPGSDVEALREAVRATGAQAFGGYEWIFAIHQDKDHPHAHMMVKMRGELDKKLRLGKQELYKLRETFAAAAREQGIKLTASPRAARGVGQKGVRLAVYHLRKKKIIPQVEREAAAEALTDIKKGTKSLKPWEIAMAARNQQERGSYMQEAKALREEAARRGGVDREKLLKVAADLEGYAKEMPKAKSRRQKLMEKAQQKGQEKGQAKSQSQGKDKGQGMELGL